MKPNCSVVSLLVLASVALTAQVARQETVVPLKNWATPLYWQPNQTERGALARRQAAAARVFGEPGVHQRSHLHRDHALPPGGYSRRGGEFNGISPFSGPPSRP